MSNNFFDSWNGKRFQEQLISSLKTIGEELKRSNDLKELEMQLKKEKELNNKN